MEPKNPLEKLGKIVTIAGTGILMNLMFLVASLPIITMGQALSGLLSAVRYNIRGDRWWDGFKAGFKTRFLRGTISWIVMLVIDVYMLLDVVQLVATVGLDIPTVVACIIFALMIMITFALPLLNVYVPTNILQWLRNAINMAFKAPAELLAAAGLFWAPVLMFIWWFEGFFYGFMIFVAAYYVLVATGATMILKNALVYYLLEARASGTLIADEGKKTVKKTADEDEDTDEEEDVEE